MKQSDKFYLAIGAIVSKNGLTVFLSNGGSRVLSQSDYRTAEIAQKIFSTPTIGEDNPVKIELKEFEIDKVVVKALNDDQIKISGDGDTVKIKVGKNVIENAESLSAHIESAIASKNVEGFKQFLKLAASLPKQQTVQELLEFMSRNDLPICNDGTFLVYKRLDKKNDGYVDVHSQKVKQRVGSFVKMNKELVDPNRGAECSQGLHVCSRRYIGSFSGNGLVLCKVSPIDVIAVPKNYNGSKMRTSGYQIVADISEDHLDSLQEGAESTYNDKLTMVITKMIAGDHAPVTEFINVDVNGENTVNILNTPIAAKKSVVKKVVKPKGKFKLLNKTDDVKAVKPKDMQKVMAVAKASFNDKLKEAKKLWKKGKGLSKRQIAKQLSMSRDALTKHLG